LNRDEAETICHVPGPGEPDRVWWVGFDSSHWSDLNPGMVAVFRDTPGLDPGRFEMSCYRDMAYVREQCGLLAAQAAADAQ